MKMALLAFTTFYIISHAETTPCGSLTVCAVQKCVDKVCGTTGVTAATYVGRSAFIIDSCGAHKRSSLKAVHKVVTTAPRAELFHGVVEKFDMVCIASKCNKECQACTQCTYAIEQMSALAQGEPTSGMCPKLESCVQSCLTAGDIPKILKCVADQCNVHCYDGDCPSCRGMAKRMFTIVCQQTDMLNLSHIKYAGTCPRFFSELADEYVAARRRVAV